MTREITKTKQFGVRFDLGLMKRIENEQKIKSPQKVLNFLTEIYMDGDFDSKGQKETIVAPKTKKAIPSTQKQGEVKETAKNDLGFNPDHYPDRKKGESLLDYRIRMSEKN